MSASLTRLAFHWLIILTLRQHSTIKSPRTSQQLLAYGLDSTGAGQHSFYSQIIQNIHARYNSELIDPSIAAGARFSKQGMLR
jgi:hypothetical protein